MSQLQPVIEHPVGAQRQLRGAQVHTMSDWKGWSQEPLHLRVGSRGKCILLEIAVYLRPSEGEQILYFSAHGCCI